MANIKSYVTAPGDAWDMIAKKVYGNELYADYLMKNNMEHIDTFIFDEGVTLKIPELKESNDTMPEWRRI